MFSRVILLEWKMATHSSILAWKITWKEDPDRLQSCQTLLSNWAHFILMVCYQEVMMTYWNSRHSAHSYSGQHMIIDRLVIKLCFFVSFYICILNKASLQCQVPHSKPFMVWSKCLAVSFWLPWHPFQMCI